MQVTSFQFLLGSIWFLLYKLVVQQHRVTFSVLAFSGISAHLPRRKNGTEGGGYQIDILDRFLYIPRFVEHAFVSFLTMSEQ